MLQDAVFFSKASLGNGDGTQENLQSKFLFRSFPPGLHPALVALQNAPRRATSRTSLQVDHGASLDAVWVRGTARPAGAAPSTVSSAVRTLPRCLQAGARCDAPHTQLPPRHIVE